MILYSDGVNVKLMAGRGTFTLYHIAPIYRDYIKTNHHYYRNLYRNNIFVWYRLSALKPVYYTQDKRYFVNAYEHIQL